MTTKSKPTPKAEQKKVLENSRKALVAKLNENVAAQLAIAKKLGSLELAFEDKTFRYLYSQEMDISQRIETTEKMIAELS